MFETESICDAEQLSYLVELHLGALLRRENFGESYKVLDENIGEFRFLAANFVGDIPNLFFVDVWLCQLFK